MSSFTRSSSGLLSADQISPKRFHILRRPSSHLSPNRQQVDEADSPLSFINIRLDPVTTKPFVNCQLKEPLIRWPHQRFALNQWVTSATRARTSLIRGHQPPVAATPSNKFNNKMTHFLDEIFPGQNAAPAAPYMDERGFGLNHRCTAAAACLAAHLHTFCFFRHENNDGPCDRGAAIKAEQINRRPNCGALFNCALLIGPSLSSTTGPNNKYSHMWLLSLWWWWYGRSQKRTCCGYPSWAGIFHPDKTDTHLALGLIDGPNERPSSGRPLVVHQLTRSRQKPPHWVSSLQSSR